MNLSQSSLSPKSKRRIRDAARYQSKREEILKQQASYRASDKGKMAQTAKIEKQKQGRAEKMELNKNLNLRIRMRDMLLKTPDHELGKRMLHLIKTSEIDLSIRGKATADDIEFLKTFDISPPSPSSRKQEKHDYYLQNREQKLQNVKSHREEKSHKDSIKQLNFKFSKVDPNRVVSPREIMDSSSIPENISQSQVFKFQIYKNLFEFEKQSYLDKWNKEYKTYMDDVEKLDEDYKSNFLKSIN